MKRKCLWCLKNEPKVTFVNKAHTIPKSLGGQNYNNNVCDDCNAYFGSKESHNNKYSIEEALKETFNITRRRLINSSPSKRKTGRFKSKFFEIKEGNGKYKLIIKPTFRFSKTFQKEINRGFKRGLYKMYFEELNRQKNIGFEEKFNVIRNYSRWNIGDLPVLYFNRVWGVFMMFGAEAETPILYFDRMNYLFSNDKFVEIEFLGHVFGFPITNYTEQDFKIYLTKSIEKKEGFFKDAIFIKRLTDIDLTLKIMNK